MTVIVSIFTIVSALATVIYTIITFRTLKEIKAQREATYRPDIIIDEGLFYIYSFKDENGEFPSEYTYGKKQQDYYSENLRMNSFGMNLFNIGLAAAKEVKIKYSFDLDKIFTTIIEQNKALPNDKIINIIKNDNTLEFIPSDNCVGSKCNSIHFINSQLNREFNHILPTNITNNPIKLNLPTYILEMHSILIYNFWLNETEIKKFPEIPVITLNISYLDIGNKSHSKEYELLILFQGGSKNESMNSFKVRQKSNIFS